MKPSLEKICRGPVQALRNHALKGNIDAIKDLAALSHHLCTALREVEETNLDCVASLARKVPEWPMMVGGNRASSRKELERRVERLEIGKGRDDVHIVAPKEGTSRVADLQSTSNKYVDRAEFLLRRAQSKKSKLAADNLSKDIIARAKAIGQLSESNFTEYGHLVFDIIVHVFCQRGDVLSNPDLAALSEKVKSGYLEKREPGLRIRNDRRKNGTFVQSAYAQENEKTERSNAERAAQNQQRASIKQQLIDAFFGRHKVRGKDNK